MILRGPSPTYESDFAYLILTDPGGLSAIIDQLRCRNYSQTLPNATCNVIPATEAQTVMAKKAKTSTNKSVEIRNYKAANPTASPKEIAEALGKKGVSVSAAFVSTVLSNAKRKGGNVGKRGRKPGLAATTSSGGNIQHLIEAKKLVEQVGGEAAAREALNALAKILA